MITAEVNGDPVRLDDGTDVAQLVSSVLDRSEGVAVAVNAAVVPRSEWARTTILDGDRVEVLAAAQGG